MAKTPTDIRSLARSHTDSAINVLKSVMNQKDAPPAARVSAAVAVLDRGWGKPPQFVTGDEERMKRALELTDDELAAIAAGSSAPSASTPVDPQKLN